MKRVENNAVGFKLFWYSIFVQLKLIFPDFLMGSILGDPGAVSGAKRRNKPGRNRFLPGLFLRFAPLTAPGSPRMDGFRLN